MIPGIPDHSRRRFLMRAGGGIGGLALTRLLGADGLLAGAGAGGQAGGGKAGDHEADTAGDGDGQTHRRGRADDLQHRHTAPQQKGNGHEGATNGGEG